MLLQNAICLRLSPSKIQFAIRNMDLIYATMFVFTVFHFPHYVLTSSSFLVKYKNNGVGIQKLLLLASKDCEIGSFICVNEGLSQD